MRRRRKQRGSIAILSVFTVAAVLVCSLGIFAVAARVNRQSTLQNDAESAALAGAERVYVDGLPASASAAPAEVERALLPAGVSARWSFGEEPDARHVWSWVELTADDARLRASFLSPRPVVMRARSFVAELRLGTATSSFALSDVLGACIQVDRLGHCVRREKVACSIGFGGARPAASFSVVVRQGDSESVVARSGVEAPVQKNQGELRYFDRGSDLELTLRLCDQLASGGVLRLRYGPAFLVAAGDAGALTLPGQ